MTEPTLHTTFSSDDIQALEPALKIGILATVNDDGLPHLTLISLKANTPTQMTWGQFTEGLSKGFIRTHPKVGWLVMTLDKQLWRGKAIFTHTAQGGPELEAYNNVPMFRYNAYFGIHTVYYMDLVEHSGRQALPMGQVVMAAVQTDRQDALGQACHSAGAEPVDADADEQARQPQVRIIRRRRRLPGGYPGHPGSGRRQRRCPLFHGRLWG